MPICPNHQIDPSRQAPAGSLTQSSPPLMSVRSEMYMTQPLPAVGGLGHAGGPVAFSGERAQALPVSLLLSMWRFCAILLFALVACTPPPVDHEPGRSHREPPSEGTGQGSAAGAAGYAFFATQSQMYEAFAELFAGPLTQGVRTYRIDLQGPPASEEERRAIRQLRDRAAQSMQRGAAAQGTKLVSVAFQPEPQRPDGSFVLHVLCELEDEDGRRHQEERDALVHPRGEGEPPDFVWLGPPRARPRS